MAINNDDIKWLYGKLKAKGYNVGTEQEFTSSLANEADRQWYYEKAKGMGLNMGSMADFNSMYAPQTAQPAPAPASAPRQQATPAAPAPASTPAPTAQALSQSAPAPAPQQPQQPAWHPTEQDKIRMSYQIHTMLNDFNQKSKARIAQVQRMTEPFTPEGRKKRRAMEFQAKLTGAPTKVMGITPPTSAPVTDNAQGEAETAPQQQMHSGQSPVPYGVKYVDGKPVTQWLLPDGRLTTSLIEADQAEYGARTVRLRHQFENRMKENGLDPAKPEDVEMQAQYDAQAPAYDAVAELWQEAEEKHKADKERNADREWSNYAAMGGGREMRIVTTSMNRHADNISHMTRFDLQKMMDNAWARAGSKVTANCYNRLRQQYPDASEEELQTTASQMARQLTDNAVYQYAVQQNTPKSTLEYFGRTVADMNVINSISKGLARSQAGTSGDLAAYEAAMGEYGKNHHVAQIAGTVTGMAVDPVTWMSGGVGSLAGKGAINIGGRIVAGRAATSMSTQVGSRLFSSSLTGRIITGAAAGGGNFATYEMLKEGESQFLHGGHINPETGENEGYSAGAVLSAGGHGLILGSVTGTLSPVIGNVADKTVKATTSTAGKAGVRLGEVAVSTLAEGTIFSVPEWINGDADAMDVWTDNMAMMLGFKAQHGLKSAPRVIASLRPVKPVNGRPLTQAERNHNRMDFEERIRKALDPANINNLTGADDAGRVAEAMRFTTDEREELRRAGYGELADLFSRDRVQEVSQPNPTEGAIELRAERVEAETISRNPEFDGYSSMEELMQDGNVSQSARAKAYYILTGRRLPMASVTGYTTNTDADGRVTVNSIAANGEVVTSRTFKNEQEAKQETDNIMRQAELNSVDVGERYKEAVADDMVLDAAISEVSPGADPATIKRIYREVKAGNKDVTESQKQLVEFLDDAMERNRDIADRYRPEAIREALKEETGIDVDAALRKMPSKRTKAEQDAVKTYLERLFFPEEVVRQQAAEPTAEQAEAQSQYEQGRELFGRFEEGDPTVQADVDAIALRMQEAYQAVEDAFGSEAEYYMFHVNENPWALVNDPELTIEQKDAVLYYINAKAALDGVMDASNEVADRKRAEVEESVAKRTHKDNGVIIPATMKVDDRPVYIVKGDVVMFPDGSAVDVHNSSESVVVMDAQTGEYEFTSPDQIFKVSEAVKPQDELDTALSVIEQEQMSVFGQNAIAPEEPAEGEAPIDQSADVSPEPAPETASTEEYDRGYEQGLEEAAKADDAWVANLIKIYSQNTPESMPETMKGRLDAFLYEQQRRAQSVPEMPENVPNPTENSVSDAEIAPETVSSVENGQQTALSRIPLNEQGEPRFEAVDKDTAWDGLVEAVGGETDAVDIAMAQVQQASTDLEALKKKPPTLKAPKLKGSPMAMAQAKRKAAEQYQNDLALYNQQIAEAQARIDAWNGIVAVHNTRKAELRRQQEEERRQRDAIAHDKAVARFEEEQRIKAEKQAEQERIGVHAVNPKIKEKWDAAPKVEGNEDALTLPDGSTISGRYVLTEAGAASPSHDANNGYVPTEGFPIDENGQSVNDRDYFRDKDAQQKVEGMASSYDNRALQDPVIVSKDGVVMSGNNRTMSGDIAARRGTDKAYVDYLAQFGHRKYGFTSEQVTGMKNPRVVFVPDEALPYDATTFARFNAQEKKSQGKPEAAVKLGKIVPDNVFNVIVNDISRYDRLSDYYADEKAVAHALGALMQAGVINDMQMPELRTGTALSAAGKELIENTLIGKVFQTSPDAVRQIISMPTLRQSIVMGLNEIANNRTLARNGYDISEELAKAVDLVTRAKAAMPDVYTDGMPVSPFGRMQGLFDDEFGDSRVTDATALLLADILNSGKPSDLRKILTTYNNEASQASGGQMDMFSGSIPTKEEILTTVNEHFRNATPKEQQALVDAAIAERKRRAEADAEQRERSEASEQTPNDVERSAEPQQPTAGDTEFTELEPLGKDRNDLYEDTPEEGDVFVVDQVNEDGSFDEHKVMYGFPTEQEATELIARMEATAEVAPSIELTPENWIAQFGEDGTVETPIGIVKMGANQLLKLYSLKRTEYFSMIHPTLNSPDVILEEADPKEGSERDSKYLFIKTFVKSDGTRIVHFESVTVKKDGMEVSISSHEIKDKSLKNKMQNDIVLHLDEKLSPSSEMRLTETPSESEGPDLVPTSDNVSSDGKDNTLSADKQTNGAESSEPYTITPTTYTNKKGKTSDVHLVKFNRELTKEEKSALDTFVREPLTEGKKTSRGWYDRKQGGYMMRSEEAARQLAEMIGNEEAVADAQPMTAEELREAVAPAAPAEKKPARKPKKAPINRVSLDAYESSTEAKEARVADLSARANTPVRIVRTQEEADALPTRRKRRAKGWWSAKDDEVVIVLPNNVNVADVDNTFVHEVAGHKGLRALVGEERFDEFLGEIYDHASNPIRKVIDKMTDRMVSEEADRLRTLKAQAHERAGEDVNANYYTDMAEARVEAEKKREGFRKEATEEYMSDLGGRIGSEGFEKMSRDELTLWGKIKAKVQAFLDKFLQGLKIAKSIRLNDKDLSYILYKSWKNMRDKQGKGGVFADAEDAVMRHRTGWGEAMLSESAKIEDANNRFNKELQRQVDGNLPDGHIYQLGMPSNILRSTGVPNLPIQMSATRLRAKATEYGHDFDLAEIRNLVKELQTPMAVFAYGNKGKMQNIIVVIESNGKQFIVGLSLNPIVNGKALEINSVRNVFPKHNAEWLNWISQGKLLYADKQKIQALIDKQRTILADVDYLDLEDVAKVIKTFENPTFDGDEDVRFRDGADYVERVPVMARAMYEKQIQSSMYQITEAMQDSMRGLMEFYKAVESQGAKRDIEDVSSFENAYIAENLMSSKSHAEMDEYEHRILRPLLDIAARMSGDKRGREELLDYMMAKHGLERNAYMRNEAIANGEESERDFAGLCGLTGETDWQNAEIVAQQMVDDYEAAHSTDIPALWSAVNKATKTSLQKIYNCGLISKAQYEKIRDMYNFYIPLQGFDEKTSDDVYGYLTSKKGAFSSPIKKAEGRKSKADDPLATIAYMAQNSIIQGNRNVMKQKFLTYVQNHPSDLASVNKLWLVHDEITDTWKPVFADVDENMTPDEIDKVVMDFEERMESLSQSEPDKYKRGRDAIGIPYRIVDGNIKEHQVVVKRNGESYVITINGNPRAAQAVNGLTNPDNDLNGAIGKVFNIASTVNRELSQLYTTRNPDFVVSNFIRDLIYSNTMVHVKENQGYAMRFHKNHAKVNPIRMVELLHLYEANKLDMRNPMHRMFYEFMHWGGETGYTLQRNLEQEKKLVSKIMKEARRGQLNPMSILGLIGNNLDQINRAVENSARFAAFITSREVGRDVQRSAYDAKEISVNFNKKGAGSKFMDATGQTFAGKAAGFTSGLGRSFYVFWNAAIQGTANFGKAFRKHPVKSITAATSLLLLGYIMALLADDGDDEDKNGYYNVPKYTRRSNLMFRFGEQWLTIPLPVEYRAIYGLGELAYSVTSGREEYSDAELAKETASQLSQLLPLDFMEGGGGLHAFVPSAFKPMVETATNTSWTGLPIYKNTPFNKNMPEWTKAYPRTNTQLVELSRWANEASGGNNYAAGWANFNPAQLEYLLNGYFGGYSNVINKMVKTGETMLGEREYDPSSILLVNRLVKMGDERTAEKKINSDFFKYLEEYRRTHTLLRKYEDEAERGSDRYSIFLDALKHSRDGARHDVMDEYITDYNWLNRATKDSEIADEERATYEEEMRRLKREVVSLMKVAHDSVQVNKMKERFAEEYIQQ